MTDPETTTVGPEPEPESPPPPPPPPSAAPGSKMWMAVVALFVVVGLLAGVAAALFVRVQDAQRTADDAVVLAGNQDALTARLDELDVTLSAVRTDGSATAEDLDAARSQVSALRKCVNNAIDDWAEATQSGKPASITKC